MSAESSNTQDANMMSKLCSRKTSSFHACHSLNSTVIAIPALAFQNYLKSAGIAINVLLPRLPLLELDGDRYPGALEIVLEREHDALDCLALLLDRDLEREGELLAVLLHDTVGAGPEARLREQRARALRAERQGLDVEVVRPAAGGERAGDDGALAVEER